MKYYISTRTGRIVTRNNGQAACRPAIDYHSLQEFEFSLVNEKNQLEDLTGLSGCYFAGGRYFNKSSKALLFFSNDYQISGDTIKFVVNTYTRPFLDQITRPGTEINIEFGCGGQTAQRVLLKDVALADPRVWVQGQEPEEIDTNVIYYTAEDVDSLLALKQDLITEDSRLDYSLISGAPVIPEHPASEEYVQAQVESATSGLATQEALNAHAEDDVIHVTAAEKLIWDNKLDPSAIDQMATTGYVEAATSALATKTELSDGLALKEPMITVDHKVPYDLVSGHPAIPSAVSQLQNDSGYQTAAQVDASIASATSGKADQSTVDAALALKQPLITAQNKLSYDFLSGAPDVSQMATTGYVEGQISGKLDAPSGGSEGQVLTKTDAGTEWADVQQGATVAPYDLPVSAPSAGEKWFSAASEDWTREFPAEQKAIFVDYTSGGFLNFPRVKSTANTGNIRTVEVWVNMTSGSLSGFTIPAKYQASDMPAALSGSGASGDYWYGTAGGGTRHVFVLRFLDDGSEDCPVRLNYADEWKAGVTPAISGWLTLRVVDPKNGTARINTSLSTSGGVYSVDGGEWQALAASQDLTGLSAGSEVRIGGYYAGSTAAQTIKCASGATFRLQGDERTILNASAPSGSGTVLVRYWGTVASPASGLAEIGDLNLIVRNAGTNRFCYNAELTTVDGLKLHGSAANGAGAAASMFANCPRLTSVNSDIFSDVPGQLTANGAFQNCAALTGSPDLTAPSAVAASAMFQNCASLTHVGDIGQNVISAQYMFQGCSALSGFDGPLQMPQVKDLVSAFQGSGLKSIEINAPAASGMPEAFADCQQLETAAVTGGTACANLTGMFRNCPSLTGATLSVPTSGSPLVYPDFKEAFKNCGSLVSVDFPVGYQPYYVNSAFQNCSALTGWGGGLGFQKVFSADNAFKNCAELETVENFLIQSIYSEGAWSSANRLFQGCGKLKNLPNHSMGLGNLGHLQHAFDSCSSLAGASHPEQFNLHYTRNVDYMFKNCTALTGIGLANSTWNWPAVSSAVGAFDYCTALTGFHDGFSLPSAVDARGMFAFCDNLSSLPAGFSLAAARQAGGLFHRCTKLSGLPAGFSLPNVSAAYGTFESNTATMLNASLFENCTALTGLPEGFSLSAAVNAQQTFYNCTALTGLPAGFSLPNATNISFMFSGCSNLSTLPENMCLSAATNGKSLFRDCRALTGLPDGIDMSGLTNDQMMFYGVNNLTTIGANVKIGSASLTNDSNNNLNKSKITSIGENFVYMPGVTWSGTYDPAVGIRTWFPNLTAEGTPSVWRVYQYTNESQG